MTNTSISLESLEQSAAIIVLDRQIQHKLSKCCAPIVGFEKRMANSPLWSRRGYGPLFEPFEVSPRLSEALDEIRQRRCAVTAVQSCWNLGFSQSDIENSTVALATALMGSRMNIRDSDAVSVNALTGNISSRYPSNTLIRGGLDTIAEMMAHPVIERLPIVSALLVWVFFYRLHPLPDGNGRTSRVILNFALRNYGMIDEAKIFVAPAFFTNLRHIGNSIRLDFSDPVSDISRFLQVMLISLQFLEKDA